MSMQKPTVSETEAAERWLTVQRRTRGANFIYAVATTGIYCAPGCPARTPLRRNVRFFATAADAQAAGYRACKRCQQ